MNISLLLLSGWSWAGSVDIFQAQPIVPDGETTHVVQLRIPKLAQGDALKVQSLGAVIDAQTIDSDGLLTLEFRARTIQPKDVLAIKIQGKEKGIDEVVELELAKTTDTNMVIRFDPPRLMPDQMTTVVKIQIDDLDFHQPVLQASHGTLSDLNVAGDGLWTALYTAPSDLNQPQAVLFSAVDLANPDNIVNAATLPIARETEVTVEGLKGTVLRPILRGEQLEDVAILNGKATIKAVLFPEDTFAKGQIIKKNGKSKNTRITFENPSKPVTDIIVPPPLLNVPRGQNVTWWVVASDAKGGFIRKAERAILETDQKEELQVVRSGFFKGEVSFPSVGESVDIRASINGVDDRATVNLVPNLPQITATFEPEDLSEAKKIQWSLLAKDGSGAMVNDLEMKSYTSAGDWRGAFKADEEGGYVGELRLSKPTANMLAYASPLELNSQLPAARVHIIPSIASMPVNHSEGVPVFVAVEDVMGMPKENIAVDLRVPIGDGIVPAQVKTDESGIAMFMYRAGPTPGPVLISAKSGRMVNAIRLDQVAEGRVVEREVALGTEANRQARNRWRSALPMIYVDEKIDTAEQQQRLSLIEQGKTIVVQEAAPPPVVVAPVVEPTPATPPPAEEPVQAAVVAAPAPKQPVTPEWEDNQESAVLVDESSTTDEWVVQATDSAVEPQPQPEPEPEPEPERPKEKKVRAASNGPMAGHRIRLLGGYSYYSYQQTTSENTDVFPPDVPFSSGILGGGLSLDSSLLADKVGISAQLNASPYKAMVGDLISNESLVTMGGSAQYRIPLGSVVTEVGAGYQQGRGIIFKYGDTQDTAEISRLQIGGFSLNVGAAAQIGAADVRFRLTELFILTPAQTSANIMLDYPSKDLGFGQMVISSDLGLDLRYFEVESSGELIQIKDNNVHLWLGVGIRL